MAGALSGCTSSTLDAARADYYRRDYAGADARLAPLSAQGGRSAVLVAMERGTALHEAGRYEQSNAEFLKAAQTIRDLETKSVSKEAAGLAYSDAARDYRGEIHERTLVHAYLMMNYFLMNQSDEALVEARRVVGILDEENRPGYAQDPFTRFLAAIAYDIRGAHDDAYIELKKVAKMAPAFPYAKAPLLRIAKQTGRKEDLARWQSLPGPESDFGPNAGVLVAFVAMGRSPVKEQREMLVPPAYRFVVPDYAPRSSGNAGAFLSAGGFTARSHLLTDVEESAVKGLRDRIGKEIAKETGRQILGEGVAKVIEHNVEDKAQGHLFSWMWRLFFAATRTTDTRSWETLPETLQVAVLSLPAGTCEPRIRFHPGASSTNEVAPGNMQIRPGRYTFVSARGF